MNPSWPPELRAVFERSMTAELATLTASGRPITIPTTPYPGKSGDTLDVSTGLAYPAKAERARRDPRVALLFADPVGTGIERPPVVLVQGLATVRDADLQANTDRYVAASVAKLPDTVKGKPKAALRRMAWYYARIWIEVTPLHMRWWAGRDLSEAPQEWNAPEGTAAPLSDPAPPGAPPGPWTAPPGQWRPVAAESLARLALQDLSVVGPNGFPLCLPTRSARMTDDGVELELGAGAPALTEGPACLTLHGHPERFTGQENHTLVGSLTLDGGRPLLRVDRALGHWSLVGGPLRMAVGFLSKGPRLRKRVRAESARRGQPVPLVRFPGDSRRSQVASGSISSAS